ncbi:MAG: deoxyribonuclease IV [Candidatus Limnocylindrales bacterium]
MRFDSYQIVSSPVPSAEMIPDPLAALGGRRAGPHLPLGAGMVKAADRAREIGATTVQIFADNPTAWRRRSEPPKALEAFGARLTEHDIQPLAIHAAYLVNLAGPEDDFWERSVAVLAAELLMGARYGAASVNVHIGSHRGRGPEAGRRRLGMGLQRVLAAVPAGPGSPRVVLENSAGGGDGLGSTLEDLEAILEAIAATGADLGRVAFCLDTAHLWGAGHEISRPEVVDALLEGFDRRLGPARLAMIHLNDSKAALGSHLDRHQHVGAGSIGPAGMGHLLRHPRLAGVPFVFETPGMEEGYDAVNMERVRLLVADQPLPTLAPGALKLKGSRARGNVAPAE